MTTNREERLPYFLRLEADASEELDASNSSVDVMRRAADKIESLQASLLSAQETVERMTDERDGWRSIIEHVAGLFGFRAPIAHRSMSLSDVQCAAEGIEANFTAAFNELKAERDTALASAEAAGKRVTDLEGALRFILAFYEPGQTYLDTNAWKLAEADARRLMAESTPALSLRPREANTLTPPPQSGTGRVVE